PCMVTGSSPLICRATEPAVPPRSTHPPHSPQTCSTPCPRRPTSPSVTHWARPCCCSPYLDCVAPAPSTATPPGCLGTGTWRPCAPANTPPGGSCVPPIPAGTTTTSPPSSRRSPPGTPR